ncbi:hypothetical protein B0T18DRAFT_387514 [Schizothecium vesticola]|uniref:AA1-like domain-containing protein n=1 Tax=Schizothecium vesticola TaxID=314040 RepID=A0AA40KA66_9PEZI|nr:hypothetical protein B0T18DRAFT_387514 [Schizothecium vesticola]
MKAVLFYLQIAVFSLAAHALPSVIIKPELVTALEDPEAPPEPPVIHFVPAQQQNATIGPLRRGDDRYTEVTAYTASSNCQGGGKTHTWRFYIDQQEGCITFQDGGLRWRMYSLLYSGEFSSFAMYTSSNCNGGAPDNSIKYN